MLKLLSSVNSSHVGFKVSYLTETLSTLRVDEGLLSSVNFNVVIKASFFVKTFSTLFAGERFLSVVNFHVPVKA